MNIAFISTGTELLKGSAVNTNLRCFGSSLAAAGIPLHYEIACGDKKQEIAEALSAALKSCEILLISLLPYTTESLLVADFLVQFL